ncbi:MAG TPA: low temperature requirement protein A [Solirubrobacteraceae bacterium]|nr:low temperature requirement protein A [Solirubrobacteraceae bacterium]
MSSEARHGRRLSRHLRSRDRPQSATPVELFFDLVYVFAVTQLSHLLISHLNLAGAGHVAFLLVVVWWAWIYTTWMVNWFDPSSGKVRLILICAALASLLLSAAIPRAFGSDALLFAISYVALQVGRNVAATALLPREHALRLTLERICCWSFLSGCFWIAGGVAPGHLRFALWGPALIIDLAAPIVGYWTPGLGRSVTEDYPVEGGHFAERFQSFIIIALGESIVVTGASASARGLDGLIIVSLSAAFVGIAALWWLYFGEVAAHSRQHLEEAGDTGVLARDAYSYLHLPIVAGIIMVAVGDELLIVAPDQPVGFAAATMMIGGPALYLVGESFFRLRMIGSVNPKRVLAVLSLILLGALASGVSALAVSVVTAVVLAGLAAWEYPRAVRVPAA